MVIKRLLKITKSRQQFSLLGGEEISFFRLS
jgi:hypothetical protein